MTASRQPHLTDEQPDRKRQREIAREIERQTERETKMKMRLLTFVNCGSFEMRTKRQLNLSCAPLIAVVVVVAAVLTDVDNDATVIFDAMR